MSLLISKLNTVGPDAAFDYLCDPINSLGKRKVKSKTKIQTFGPNNKETIVLLKSLAVKRKPTFWNVLEDAVEQERRKQFPPVVLYRLESPKEGEWVEKNPLTEEEFQASI
jgi:hypothetical protein